VGSLPSKYCASCFMALPTQCNQLGQPDRSLRWPAPAVIVEFSNLPLHAIVRSQPGRGTPLAGIETDPGSGYQNFGKTAGSLSNSAGHLSRIAYVAGRRWCELHGGTVDR